MKKLCFVEGAVWKDEQIHLPISDGDVMKKIEAFETVILKKVFNPDSMLSLKQRLAEHAVSHSPQNIPIQPGAPNFYRMDVHPEKSKLKRLSKVFSSFYWNAEDIAGEKIYLKSLARLRSRLTGLPEEYAFYRVEEDYISSPTVVQYPAGGGYLMPHSDPPSRQKVVVVAIMSRRGVDYKTGGVYVEDADGSHRILVDEMLECGDIYLMNPAVRHGVAPIDPQEPLDFNSTRGRWMMFSTLIAHTSLSGQKTEGLITY